MLAGVMDVAELVEVIGRAQRREPEAFDALVAEYSTRLYGYFYRLTGRRPEAEDLLQELFVRVVRMIGQYQHDGRFDAWLFRIAANLVRDRVRRSQTSKRAGFVEEGGGAGAGESDPLSQVPDRVVGEPVDAMERAETFDRLQWAIGQLPAQEREVILLRHFSQMSFAEIAEVMKTPMGTALARAHRGLARLRELMRECSA